MDSYWNTSQEQDCFITFRSLIKSNNGFFKSQAQSNLVNDGRLCTIYTKLRTGIPTGATDEEVAAHRKNQLRSVYGFLTEKDAHVISLSGSVSFAHYGRKSHRPILHFFLFDTYGIIAQYKMHFSNNNVVKELSEIIWERDRGLPLPAFKPIEQVKLERETKKIEANANTSFLGEKGKRQFFEGVIKSVTYNGTKQYGFKEMDSYRTIILTDDGNTIIYWNKIADEGKHVKFKATVKDHCEYNHVKQTIVSHPKNIEIL